MAKHFYLRDNQRIQNNSLLSSGSKELFTLEKSHSTIMPMNQIGRTSVIGAVIVAFTISLRLLRRLSIIYMIYPLMRKRIPSPAV